MKRWSFRSSAVQTLILKTLFGTHIPLKVKSLISECFTSTGLMASWFRARARQACSYLFPSGHCLGGEKRVSTNKASVDCLIMPSQQRTKSEEDLEFLWGFMKDCDEQLGITSVTQQWFYTSHLKQSVIFVIFFQEAEVRKQLKNAVVILILESTL